MNIPNLSLEDLVDYAPPCLVDDFPLDWQMTRAERFTLIHILKKLQPELSIEIGTYKGGSLQVLSRYSKAVVSVDILPSIAVSLGGLFSNVTFMSGDSSILIPRLIEQINASEERVGLVLIDGDHSEEGVRRDITNIFSLRPKRPIGIVMHDSFKPPCRAGMQSANWEACPYIHYVELDFVAGVFLPGRATVNASMAGGFAFALMLPEKRDSPLNIYQSQLAKFQLVSRFADRSGFLTGSPKSGVLQRLGHIKSKVGSAMKRL